MKGCRGGLAPHTQEVVVVWVWWNVIDVIGVELFVDFQWASGGWMVRPLPSGPASSPLSAQF